MGKIVKIFGWDAIAYFFMNAEVGNNTQYVLFKNLVFVKSEMGLIRLRVREFAQERGWTLKEVS